jgi:hypothetical protein
MLLVTLVINVLISPHTGLQLGYLSSVLMHGDKLLISKIN